jgi:hypothetical protein
MIDMSTSDDELGRVAKRRIDTGELPCHPGARMWGSRGSGATCSLCDRPIRAEEVEYEVAADVGVDECERVFHFHISCHAVWQAECARLRSAHAHVR